MRGIFVSAAIFVVGLAACGNPSEPSDDGDRPCELTAPPPDSSWFSYYTSRGLAEAVGRGVTWYPESGTLNFVHSYLEGSVYLEGPAHGTPGGECVMEMTDAQFVLYGTRRDETYGFDRTRILDDVVQITYISDNPDDTRIAGYFSQILWSEELAQEDSVYVEFAVAGLVCDLPSSATGAYRLETPGGDTYVGTRTRWSPSIGFVALGEDSLPTTTMTDPGTPRHWGMTLSLKGPESADGTLTLVYAQFTTSEATSGTAEEVNPRTYVFPPEAGYDVVNNDLIEVSTLGDFSIVAEGTIPMQRQALNPTGGIEWYEEMALGVCFDAR